MQGQRGASLAKTRQIWRRMYRTLVENREIVAAKRLRPGYDESRCLRAELVRDEERSLAPGSDPPVGVLAGPWRQVCQEFHDRPEAIATKPRRVKPPL